MTAAQANDVITDYKNEDNIVINDDKVVKFTQTKNTDNIVFTLASKKTITIKDGADKIISYSDDENPNGITYPESPVEYNKKGTSASLSANYLAESFGPSDYSAYVSTLATIDASAITHDLAITGSTLANHITGSEEADTIYGGNGSRGEGKREGFCDFSIAASLPF